MKFCVIGLSKFGHQLATTLANLGNQVLAVDKNQAIVDSISNQVTQAICMEVTSQESLVEIGIEDIQTAVVAMGNDFAQSVLMTVLLKKNLNIPTVIARAINPIHANVLKLLGADQVISLENEMAVKLAHKLSMPVGDMIYITENFVVAHVPATLAMENKKLEAIHGSFRSGAQCIGVRKGGQIFLVSGNYTVLAGDVLIFAGEKRIVENILRM